MTTDTRDEASGAEMMAMNEQLLIAGLHQHELAQTANESMALYRTLAENFPNGIVLLFDADLRHTLAYGAAMESMGLSKADLEGRTIWEGFPATLCEQVAPLYGAALRGESSDCEIWFGARVHELRALPVRNFAGDIVGGMVVTQDITDRKIAEQERGRELSRLEAREKRQSVISHIAQAVLRSRDPIVIQGIATSALGKFLGADRCFFCFYDEHYGTFAINTEWRRERVKSMVDVYQMDDYPDLIAEYRRTQTPIVIEDISSDPRFSRSRNALKGLRLSASIRVPMFEGGRVVAVLCVSMVSKSRVWSADEVSLVETVAATTKVAIDDLRQLLRERKIALELQGALLPEMPKNVPGLAVRRYYASALQESTVGGDFYDVYPLDDDRAALCVGDVSGKGLAAATQVGALRHMLRAALYLDRTLLSAVNDLNKMLANREMLTGFATLWVSIYESSTRTLYYVNCGQEPALIRRAATGRVEECAPTGPVIGTFVDAEFRAASATLESGDILAVFTDGLTEIGPNRRDQLGLDGLARVLEHAPALGDAATADQKAESIVGHVIAQVIEFADSVVRDDMCLLVAVAE